MFVWHLLESLSSSDLPRPLMGFLFLPFVKAGGSITGDLVTWVWEIGFPQNTSSLPHTDISDDMTFSAIHDRLRWLLECVDFSSPFSIFSSASFSRLSIMWVIRTELNDPPNIENQALRCSRMPKTPCSPLVISCTSSSMASNRSDSGRGFWRWCVRQVQTSWINIPQCGSPRGGTGCVVPTWLSHWQKSKNSCTFW